MMKAFFAVLGCCAVFTLSAAEVKVFKRHMEGEAAKQAFSKELKNAMRLPEDSEELTREFFAKNYKAVFAPFYAKDESGQVVMTRKFDENGKMVQLLDKGAKVTPASAKEVWESLEAGDTIVVRTNLMEPCGFCDGLRYVDYFPEEVKALAAFNDKYHRQHSVKEEKSDTKDYDRYEARKMNQAEKDARRRERKLEEFKAFCERAEAYGWSDVSEEVKTRLKVDDEKLENMACCWTAIHEEKSPRFRHMCPVCKGKVTMKVARTRKFEVSK